MNHRSKHILIPPKSYLVHDKISMGHTHFPQQHKTTSTADVLLCLLTTQKMTQRALLCEYHEFFCNLEWWQVGLTPIWNNSLCQLSETDSQVIFNYLSHSVVFFSIWNLQKCCDFVTRIHLHWLLLKQVSNNLNSIRLERVKKLFKLRREPHVWHKIYLKQKYPPVVITVFTALV